MEMQTISCYEKLRLQNIERNQLFLRQLGLESIVAVPDAKDPRPKRKLEETEEPSDLRRSHRLASFPATTSFEELGDDYSERLLPDKPDLKMPKRSSAPQIQKPPSADSCRAMNANLAVFFGATSKKNEMSQKDGAEQYALGELIDSYGKAAVMAVANNGVQPKFSKYSGVCEWNNCVFLWVNIMKQSCKGYNNTFNEQGRFMTWFGGSKMSADSAVVKRLLAAPSIKTLRELASESAPAVKDEVASKNGIVHLKDEEHSPESDESDSIVLFVRIEGENYSCMGRVAYISHDLTTQPIEFEWELLDYQIVKEKPLFKRILET